MVKDTAMDVEGNVYRTIQIGNKLWMIDNLRTTKLNDGTPIANITTENMKYANGSSGILRTTPAFSWHNNLSYNKQTYGGLYNWYALETRKLAPPGWRVATKEDWAELENYLATNGYNYDGSKTTAGSVTKVLKSMSSDLYWISSSMQGSVGNGLKANNKSGLSLTPSGYRDGLTWGVAGINAGYWTSTLYDSISANSRLFSVNDSGIVQTRTDLKQLAYAVRCVKDVVSTPTAGAITDAILSNLNAGFITRRDAAFEALRTSPLVVAPLDYSYPTTTGCPLSRAFSFSLTDYAFKCLWLNRKVDSANIALTKNADFYLSN
ncbi:MAG: fibrobacter succinogenes major paralogous domain-containing protein, partial [Bacteroidota bacterium]|nr:fibrobacter succinogenes major paralogous domain-containing protein [Bacteroidota bacterium]